MDKNRVRKSAAIFSALGDETRLGLVQKLIAVDRLSISELSEDESISRQAVTKHLQVLKDVGLVACEAKGRENLFRLNPEPLDVAMDLLESVERKWDQRLARLKLLAENTD